MAWPLPFTATRACTGRLDKYHNTPELFLLTSKPKPSTSSHLRVHVLCWMVPTSPCLTNLSLRSRDNRTFTHDNLMQFTCFVSTYFVYCIS